MQLILGQATVQYYSKTLLNQMNFLNFLTSGAGIFNFNLQNSSMNNSSNTLLRNLTLPIPAKSPIAEQSQELKEDQCHKDIPEPPNLIERIMTTSQTQLLTHQQQLINQYMHLNIQLLSKKIQSLQNNPDKKQDSQQIQIKSNKKKIKKQNTNCGHNDKEHYAKGMCNNCYHKNGRTKKPWKCPHEKLYANGLCQNCYINKYNKMKREKSLNSDPLNLEGLESRQLNSEPKMEDLE